MFVLCPLSAQPCPGESSFHHYLANSLLAPGDNGSSSCRYGQRRRVSQKNDYWPNFSAREKVSCLTEVEPGCESSVACDPLGHAAWACQCHQGNPAVEIHVMKSWGNKRPPNHRMVLQMVRHFLSASVVDNKKERRQKLNGKWVELKASILGTYIRYSLRDQCHKS